MVGVVGRNEALTLASDAGLDLVEIAPNADPPVCKILSDAGLSVGRVNDIREALALPVVAERDLFVSPEQMHWPGGLPLLRLPIDRDGTGPDRPPPKLGEHTAEVLREAGIDDATLKRLNRP